MKVVVTGGSGFIGSHVVVKLASAGHDVLVLDQRAPAAQGIAWKDVDICDLDAMIKATAGYEVIYHLAAVSNVDVAFEDPVGCIEANLVGTTNVLESARLHKMQRALFASTVWVYNATQEKEGDENSAFVPARVGHLYTATKLSGELLHGSYYELYKVPYTILRFGIPFGPGMRPELVIAALIKKALTKQPLTLTGDGKQFRKFIYVEDLAEGVVAALQPEGENQTYTLDGARSVTILEIAETLKRILGDVEIQFTPARPGDFGGAQTSIAKAAHDLRWKPTTAFEDGVRRTIEWMRQA